MSSHSSRSRWQVQRERFQLDDSQRPLPPRADQPVSAAVPGVMKSLGLESEFWTQTLLSEWPAVVGEQLARYTRPGRVLRQTLYVFVRNPVWLSELSRLGSKQILENVQRRHGADKVRSVRLELDPDPKQRSA